MVETEAVADIEHGIQELLKTVREDDEPRPEPIDERNIPHWDLDAEIEHLVNKTIPELWRDLGIPDGKMPQMAKWRDPDLEWTTWNGGTENCPEDRKQPAELRWHQLAGLKKMAESLMAGQGFVNFDDVGLGKTLQTIALIMYRINQLAAQDTGGPFLGSFGKWLPCVACSRMTRSERVPSGRPTLTASSVAQIRCERVCAGDPLRADACVTLTLSGRVWAPAQSECAQETR